MAEVSAAAVRALRDRTDLPMMDCKKALIEAGGDEEKALDVLRRQGQKAIDKRKDNPTSEGRFHIEVAPDGMSAALVEILCESAPVAKSEDFILLASKCAQQALYGPGAIDGDELLKQPVPGMTEKTLSALLLDTVNKIRENIKLGRVMKVAGPVGGYVHHDGKTAVLFRATGANATNEILRDVAMHIAALRPKVTLPGELDPALVSAERARLTEETLKTGKPANIAEKIVDGRMRIFYVEQGVLVEQPFAKDDSKTVAKALSEVGMTAVGYSRLVLGVM